MMIALAVLLLVGVLGKYRFTIMRSVSCARSGEIGRFSAIAFARVFRALRGY